jgi:hypothetical protein
VSGLTQARTDLQKARWLSGESPQPWTDHTAAGLRSLTDAAEQVRGAVADIQPALLAGGMQAIYGATEAVVAACDSAIRATETFRENVTDGDREVIGRGVPYGEWENRVRYVQSLWEGVRSRYDAVADSLEGLSNVAHSDLEDLREHGYHLGMPGRLPSGDTPEDAVVALGRQQRRVGG